MLEMDGWLIDDLNLMCLVYVAVFRFVSSSLVSHVTCSAVVWADLSPLSEPSPTQLTPTPRVHPMSTSYIPPGPVPWRLAASKFAPLPWRLGRRSVVDACK